MITRTWKNNLITARSESFNSNPLQWVHDFEMELVENNRAVFLKVYNTDVDEYWLETAKE